MKSSLPGNTFSSGEKKVAAIFSFGRFSRRHHAARRDQGLDRRQHQVAARVGVRRIEMPEALAHQPVVAVALAKADKGAAAPVDLAVEAPRRHQHGPGAQIVLGHAPRRRRRVETVGQPLLGPFFAAEPFVSRHVGRLRGAQILPSIENPVDAIPQRRGPLQPAPIREIDQDDRAFDPEAVFFQRRDRLAQRRARAQRIVDHDHGPALVGRPVDLPRRAVDLARLADDETGIAVVALQDRGSHQRHARIPEGRKLPAVERLELIEDQAPGQLAPRPVSEQFQL